MHGAFSSGQVQDDATVAFQHWHGDSSGVLSETYFFSISHKWSKGLSSIQVAQNPHTGEDWVSLTIANRHPITGGATRPL